MRLFNIFIKQMIFCIFLSNKWFFAYFYQTNDFLHIQANFLAGAKLF